MQHYSMCLFNNLIMFIIIIKTSALDHVEVLRNVHLYPLVSRFSSAFKPYNMLKAFVLKK